MDAGIRPSLRAISSVDTRMDHQRVTDAVQAAVMAERERCAKIADASMASAKSEMKEPSVSSEDMVCFQNQLMMASHIASEIRSGK